MPASQAADQNVIAIDLFAGAGGMSLGATRCGVDVLEAIDLDVNCCRTYAQNHPKTRVLNLDISLYKPTLRPSESRGKQLMLFGGPPCQGFSTSNQQTRNILNPLNWLFKEYFRLAKLINPNWIVIENVKGLIETEGGYFYDRIQRSLRSLGYKVEPWVLNASDFGIPQRRTRLFIVACLDGRPPPQPKGNSESVTVEQAIGDLPLLENGANVDRLQYRCDPKSDFAKRMRGRHKSSTGHLVTSSNQLVIERYKNIPPGGNWKSIPPAMLANYQDPSRCHTRIYHRLGASDPAPVIGNFRKNMLIHPIQNRGLSVREAARLQSFPDKYLFTGTIGFQQQQVGNAVPPLLSEAVFRALVSSTRR